MKQRTKTDIKKWLADKRKEGYFGDGFNGVDALREMGCSELSLIVFDEMGGIESDCAPGVVASYYSPSISRIVVIREVDVPETANDFIDLMTELEAEAVGIEASINPSSK